MLEVESVGKDYAGVVAVAEVSFGVEPAESVGVVGPNGSGKTTLLNIISGFARPDRGRIVLGGREVTGRPAWTLSGLGVARTFQLPQMPARMSVLEVVLAGARQPVSASPLGGLVRLRRSRAELAGAVERADGLLERVGLRRLRDDPAASLSGGQQKLLNLVAALIGDPRLLLLDEPTAGVSPPLRKVLVGVLEEVRAKGTAIVTVEHDMAFVSEVCERVVVLDGGSVIARCAPSELHLDEQVVEAYLGKRRADRGTRSEVG
ncbi:MAG TPA: ABC transporter ATP-binding protein [Solirubrobacterales bacterium]|nr:ABC transporter ATP-binding protein [Solirubrobacterales bacterium]